ncbi:MAG: ASCH domain-containing protein [Candidatus Limnocylindrales bacterium]
MTDDVAVERMWAAYVEATGATGRYTAWGFGEPIPALMTELGLLVRDGPKRATASRMSDFDTGAEPMPMVGEHSVILDGEGRPLCIIRTASLEVRAFGDVDEAFAWDEGEGDRTLADWRQGHLGYFKEIGAPVDDSTQMLLERFAKVWPPPADPPA